jgi:hypothetical protein
MRKQIIVMGIATAVLLVGGVAAACAQTGNDNGHGDHGCHTGEKGNDTIVNEHCKSPKPSESPSPSPSQSPSPSVSPSNTPEVTPKPSATPSPSVSPSPTPSPKVLVLPATGGTGRKHQ